MGRRAVFIIAIAAGTLTSCGDGADTPLATETTDATGSSTTATTEPAPGVVKQDHLGVLRVPATAERVEFEHTDPYVWTAKLSFTGDMRSVVRELRDNLIELGFDMHPLEGEPSSQCLKGTALPDGTGECFINGHVPGGGGEIEIQARRLTATEPGVIDIHRTYGHRTPGDAAGPPWPEPHDGPPDGEGLERDTTTSR